MASKKDLVEGQSFSRRRLITAFVSGAPGGREVEPGKPLRAVVGGVVLSAILVVGALAAGLLAPTLPDGWDQDSLVIAEDTGARYVALGGVLYPVINTASARLLIPSGFKVVSAKAEKFTNSKRGPTRGIIGAPDALPTPATLVDTGWTSCTSADSGVETRISRTPVASVVDDKAVIVGVVTGGATSYFLVDNGLRYSIPTSALTAVKRALELETAADYTVAADWLNLFARGPDIDVRAFAVTGPGKDLSGVDGLPDGAQVGSVVADTANPDRPYLLLDGGTIAPLTPFAYALYRTGDAAAPNVLTVPGPVFASLGVADPVWPSGWPADMPTPLNGTPCALLTAGTGGVKPEVLLAASPADPPTDQARSAVVDAGAGALVRAIGAASLDNGAVFLIDQTGSAFPISGSGETDPIAQLGFARTDIVPVPQAWIRLLDLGPTLSAEAAQKQIAATAGR